MVERRTRDYALDLLWAVGLASVSLYFFKTFAAPYFGNLIDPDREKRERARLQAKAHLERLRRSKHDNRKPENDNGLGYGSSAIEEMDLNEYENLVALEMVAPSDIPVGFSDVAGLEDIIEELRESVIYPLTMPHLYSHAAKLLAAPPGVLLYGPPGCGKTMLAKALAQESGASFINLHISTITEKWYGDSNKLVRAVFSLARKVEPAIIFIDEIDAVLGTRQSGEHEASGMVKAEFMTLWDGLTSSNAQGTPARIVVLGATNRVHDIDNAFLRRLPKKFAIPLPGVAQRCKILELILRDTKRDAHDFDFDYIAHIMAGMSGSDIKEACRDAAMAPVREYLREHRAQNLPSSSVDSTKFRGIRTSDFLMSPGGMRRLNDASSSTTTQLGTEQLVPMSNKTEDEDTSN